MTRGYNDDHRRHMQCNYEKTHIFAFKTTEYRGPLNARKEHYCFENHFMSFVSICHNSDALDLKKIPAFLDEVSLTLQGCELYCKSYKLSLLWRHNENGIQRENTDSHNTGQGGSQRVRCSAPEKCEQPHKFASTSLPRELASALLLADQSTDHALRPGLKSYWLKEFPQNYLKDFHWE